jgi:shikimate kinase
VRIPVIFEFEGEAGFRRREAQTLQELTAERGMVLATGGGVVLDPENRRRLAQTGLVVYLSVPLDELFERTRRDRNRPLLQVADPQGRLAELHAQRDPLYREIADVVIEGGGRSLPAMVRLLEEEIRKTCEP